MASISSLYSKIRQCENKIRQYRSLQSEINKLMSSLPNVNDNLTECYNHIASGGLLTYGKSADNGKIEEIINDINIIKRKLNNIISEINSRIYSLQREIEHYRSEISCLLAMAN